MTYVRKGYSLGERHHAARLTLDDVGRIRRGEMGSDHEAARTLGVSHVSVFYARTGRNWASCPVPPVRSSEDMKSLDR